VTVVTRVREHGDKIREAGLHLIPFENARGGLNPVVEFWTLLRLVRVCRRERPDIAHYIALKPVLYGSTAARMTGVRAVVNTVAGMGLLFSETHSVAKTIKR